MDRELEKAFYAEMVRLYEEPLRLFGYHASIFKRMVADHGGVEAARRLVRDSTISDGLGVLAMHGRLDLTSEAAMLRGRFPELFEPEELDLARAKLRRLGYGGPEVTQ